MSAGLVYLCCEDRRRAELRRKKAGLNGIDFLEVLDAGAASEAERQRVLRVHFVNGIGGLAVTAANVRIDGGERIAAIPVDKASVEDGVLVVRVATRGDYSTYRLSLVEADGEPLATLDPLLAAVDFSFKVECRSDFDCRPACACPPAPREEPPIDYLAKDYESFRRLLLERMSLLAPDWQERSPADLGVALVELVAYLADRLSYEQDVVAGEAYLGTARRRTSVRRHATLLDYPMHDGCNARTFVQLRAKKGTTAKLTAGTRLLTRLRDAKPSLDPDGYAKALDEAPEVFEAMHPIELRDQHNEIDLYAWGERECCLPQGATKATLAGHFPQLKQGDLLLFEELIGPRTGKAADADPAHRHVVRLSQKPVKSEDPLFPRVTAGVKKGRPVTEVEWGLEDALPFPLCLSARADAAHGREYLERVSVARANVLLADHGRTIESAEQLKVPPQPRLATRSAECERCGGEIAEELPARFHPPLAEGPLTQTSRVSRTIRVEGLRQRLPFDPEAAATAALVSDPARALPAIVLREPGRAWYPQRDLLSSEGFAAEFVVECDGEGGARLRFGDGENGARPTPQVPLSASYRVGNGSRGNVGAGAIRHLVSADAELRNAVESLHNPLPARGGVEPESLERVRIDAPRAFKQLTRAVTPEDYATIAERHPDVQRAQATIRWTGSWRTVYLTVDRRGGRSIDDKFEAKLRDHLEPYRMAGHDLEIDAPSFVALEIGLDVCVEPDYFASDVERALYEALGSGVMADGRRGLFHPDNLSFGEAIPLSPIVAAAAAVTGVREVEVVAFQRLDVHSHKAIDEGKLPIGRLEIARLANDPSFPEGGVLRLNTRGGR